MAYGRRRTRIPYEETDAGIREAKVKARNLAYTESLKRKTKGFTRVLTEAKGAEKDVLEAVRALSPRDSWKHIGGSADPSTGQVNENLFSLPGVGYFVDYGMGGAYYVSPRAIARIKAKSSKHSTWKGKGIKLGQVSRTPMLRRLNRA